MKISFSPCLSLLLCSGCLPAGAVELSDRVELHGYGNQDYLQTSANTYLGADSHGSWDNNVIALVGTIVLNEKSKFWVQLESEAGEPARFDWYFVDYHFNDRLRAQVGHVKMPFGLYNETIDARYLLLSAVVPALYQPAASVTHEVYEGVGLDYESTHGRAGALRAQVWAGNTVTDEPEADLRDRRAFGGRFTWSTPVEGLKLLLSGFRTEVQIFATDTFENEDRTAVSLDYVNRGLDLKAEYAAHELLDEKGETWYAQGGYTFAEKWVPYARYEHVSTDTSLDDDPAYYQNIAVLGLGYRIGSNFSVRVENHFNRGYALPVAGGEVAPGEGRRRWNLLAASVNFIF